MLSEVFYDADRFKRNIAKDRPQPVEKVTVCTSRTIYFQEFIENGFGDLFTQAHWRKIDITLNL